MKVQDDYGKLPRYPGKTQGGNALFSTRGLGRFLGRCVAFLTIRTNNQYVIKGALAKILSQRTQKPPWHRSWGNGISRDLSEDGKPEIKVKDYELVTQLGYLRAFSLPGDNHKPIFDDGPPSFLDIAQGDRRHDSYLLACLASLLSRADGAKRLEDIMRDNKDGTVSVNFQKTLMRVSKDRLVDESGHDIYSVGKSWVRIFEKAFQGYLRNLGKGLDHGNPEYVFDALAHILGENESVRKWLTFPTNHTQNLKRTSKLDCMVTLSTKGTNHKRIIWGIIPDHEYALLFTAQSEDGSSEGYLVYDPYGSTLGIKIQEKVSEENPNEYDVIIDTKRGASAIFFISTEEIEIFFEKGKASILDHLF